MSDQDTPNLHASGSSPGGSHVAAVCEAASRVRRDAVSDHGSSYDRSAARFNGRIGSMAGGMAVAFLATAAAWAAIFFVVTQLAGMEKPVARLAFALKCIVLAVLLCFLTGIEAVSHERLQTGALTRWQDGLAASQNQCTLSSKYIGATHPLCAWIAGPRALFPQRHGNEGCCCRHGSLDRHASRVLDWISCRSAIPRLRPHRNDAEHAYSALCECALRLRTRRTVRCRCTDHRIHRG